jgi:hypothetical protein
VISGIIHATIQELLCGRFDEDDVHLFFKCKCVKGLWAALQMEDVRSKLAQPLSTVELVWEVLKLEDSVQRRVITLLYLWWTERCRVREGETLRTQEQLAQLVRCYAEEWASLKLTSTEPIPNKKN